MYSSAEITLLSKKLSQLIDEKALSDSFNKHLEDKIHPMLLSLTFNHPINKNIQNFLSEHITTYCLIKKLDINYLATLEPTQIEELNIWLYGLTDLDGIMLFVENTMQLNFDGEYCSPIYNIHSQSFEATDTARLVFLNAKKTSSSVVTPDTPTASEAFLNN
ncbi:MAG: hypothetical protein K0U24_08025 [Gammaproteobacteria bacterium]|nr:hypothetical protein [Gammaproteobacteria bacterium]MCH9717918.1 hypothetical protein [Gammaproteobacteria bacterium]MCH9764148.1 hypothetical protein [Gammaproteobacteria bacterium]